MTYSIQFSAPAVRHIELLPEKVAAAAIEFIFGSLAENPYRVGKELAFPMSGTYSARRGVYRIVYRIDEANERVLIGSIRHRSNAYRPGG